MNLHFSLIAIFRKKAKHNENPLPKGQVSDRDGVLARTAVIGL
jgi:hypothetical protein